MPDQRPRRPWWLPDTVVVATHNPGKLREWTTLLGPLGVSVLRPADLDLGEPEETEGTYLGNASLKARAAWSACRRPVLADDTGFEAESLGGLPGVDTAGWARDHGGYPAALHTLVRQAGAGTRGRLVCAVAFADADGVRACEAHVAGTLRRHPTDAPGFAAVLDGVPALQRDGVLAHRRAAFEALSAR